MRHLYSACFLLLISIVAPLPGICHDIKLAVFEVETGDGDMQMSVTADRFYLSECVRKTYPLSNESFQTLLQDYLGFTVEIDIDGECTSFEIREVTYGAENMLITVDLDQNAKEISEVKLTNSFMTELVEGHENIMKLNVNDRIRSFRLNEQRTKTIASYD